MRERRCSTLITLLLGAASSLGGCRRNVTDIIINGGDAPPLTAYNQLVQGEVGNLAPGDAVVIATGDVKEHVVFNETEVVVKNRGKVEREWNLKQRKRARKDSLKQIRKTAKQRKKTFKSQGQKHRPRFKAFKRVSKNWNRASGTAVSLKADKGHDVAWYHLYVQNRGGAFEGDLRVFDYMPADVDLGLVGFSVRSFRPNRLRWLLLPVPYVGLILFVVMPEYWARDEDMLSSRMKVEVSPQGLVDIQLDNVELRRSRGLDFITMARFAEPAGATSVREAAAPEEDVEEEPAVDGAPPSGAAVQAPVMDEEREPMGPPAATTVDESRDRELVEPPPAVQNAIRLETSHTSYDNEKGDAEYDTEIEEEDASLDPNSDSP